MTSLVLHTAKEKIIEYKDNISKKQCTVLLWKTPFPLDEWSIALLL